MIAQQKARQMWVNGGSLFRIAARELGSATQWDRIALASGLTDPQIKGLTLITIPPRDPRGGTGGVLGPK